jgi:hypothetical protein
MTPEELKTLLSRDRELDIGKFGKGGFRSLYDLLTELNTNDIKLEFDNRIGRIVLFRLSVWGILVTADGYILLETGRWHPKERFLGIFRRWRKIEKVKEYSISETVRYGDEDDIAALRRGIGEEWKYFIAVAHFTPKYIDQTWHPLAESTVYPGLLTIRHSRTYQFDLPKRPVIWDPIATDSEGDDEILMFLKWFYTPVKEPRHRKILQWVLNTFIRQVVLRIRYLF